MAEAKKDKITKTIQLPENIVKNNHEFLFIYDAKLCNPNGDPDNENKPRMDEEREINLVSDVRLKRYIRDYLQKYSNKHIYVSKLADKPCVPKDILENLTSNSSNLDFNDTTNMREFYLKNLIDVRMFGATMAIKHESQTTKETLTFTGPIQLNWGYSLNPVTINDSKVITTTFKSSEKANQSSMGTDYRVNYSLIAFYGNIIAKKCEHTLLTVDDVALFDDAIIKSIPLMATRSKIGQYPRLYLRMEYNESEFLHGDLRRGVKLELNPESNVKNINSIRDISEIKININNLVNTINILREKKLIKNIKLWKSDDISLIGNIE